jgi:ATP-binding cassette subfamily C protein CydC
MSRRGTTIWRLLGERPSRRLAKPAALTLVALGFGVGLLGLAGWFIASCAAAGLAAGSTFSFLFPSAGVQALAWARTLGRYGDRIATHEATLDLVGALRTGLFARALRLSRDRVAELRSSELLGRITVDSDAVESLLLRSSFPMLAAAAALIGAAGVFALLSWTLALVAVAGLTLTGGALIVLAHHQAGRPARRLVLARAEARRTLIETIDGLPELRSFGAEQRAAATVDRQLERFAESRRQLAGLTAGGQSAGFLLADLTLLAVVATGAGLLGTGRLPAPAFVAICLVAIAVSEPIAGLPAAVTARARARAASARLTELFPGSTPNTATAAVPCRPWPVSIAAEDHDIELALEPGDTVLLTGASGTGKSTLLRAVSGQPAPGVEVHLGRVDAASIDPEELAGRVTLVAQDAYVFDGTIRDNLKLAAPAAGERELWKALTAAALEGTVAAFPAGLDTPVGPGGQALSGGQRRRLSVAQGLLRRADVLLLDEPTEGLDASTAARLLAGVREFNRGAALVIALHDRQSLVLPWAPSARVELAAAPAVHTRSHGTGRAAVGPTSTNEGPPSSGPAPDRTTPGHDPAATSNGSST